MLCRNCEKAIQAAAKHLQRTKGMSDSYLQPRLNSSFLHLSLREFSHSIAAGCYFCQHLENFLGSDANFRIGDEHGYPDLRPFRLVDNTLTRAVNWAIQHVLIPCTIYTKANLMKRLLDAAQQWCTSSYMFWIYIDPSLQIMVMPLAFEGMQKSLPALEPISFWSGTSFLLSPILSDNSNVDPDSNASLWTRNSWTGDSTALWRYWFNTCLESHAICRSAEQSLRIYSPKRAPVYGLPETYRHALEIVNSLGHKYLWIDSLCIIQDDEKDWGTESSLMGLTYNHAVCNIAATWAADGGDGCFSTRDPTTVCPTFITLGSKVEGSSIFQISRAGDFAYDQDIAEAPLNQRGWVVQERYLARRQLSCAKRQFYWECHEVLASEEFPCGHPADNPANSQWRLGAEGSPRKPSLYSDRGAHTRRGWAELVELYSSCELTRVSDKLVALSGLANQLQDMVGDVYVFGLWKKDLCQQLCWEPYFSSSSPRATTQGRIAPTWSWANFDGPVSFDRAYYGTYHQHLYWTEVVDTPTNLTKKLTLRGLALESRISWKYREHLFGTAHYDTHLSFDTHGTTYIPPSSSTQVFIYWDEDISQDDVDPEQWSTFQKQRNSDLLFLVVRSTRCTAGKQFDGLVLRMLPHSADDPVLFVRMGTFLIDDFGDHALGHVLSRLTLAADLVQAVNII